ncbi:MAG TPA: lysylphosphatidylglycerol synthase domain-containing protein, partial [Dongiaceae bacterium]
VYLSRFRIGTLDVARSILTDRFIGLVSVILLSIPAMIFALRTGGGLAPLGWILLLLVLGLPAGLWFCWLADRWHRGRTATESRFARTVHAAAAILADFRDPRLFGIPFLQSCLMMAATILCVMSLASAIGGVAAPAWGQALFLPVIFLLSNLPISIAGIGVREAAFVSLFGAVGASAEQALALSLSFFALGVLNNLIGGLLYLIYRPSRTPPVAEA